jgi:ribosomal protein L29
MRINESRGVTWTDLTEDLRSLNQELTKVRLQYQQLEHKHDRILEAHKHNKIKMNVVIILALISTLLHGVL